MGCGASEPAQEPVNNKSTQQQNQDQNEQNQKLQINNNQQQQSTTQVVQQPQQYSEINEKPQQPNQSIQQDKPYQAEQINQPQHVQGEQPYHSEQQERPVQKADHTEKPIKIEQSEQPYQAEQSEKPYRVEQSEKHSKLEQEVQGEGGIQNEDQNQLQNNNNQQNQGNANVSYNGGYNILKTVDLTQINPTFMYLFGQYEIDESPFILQTKCEMNENGEENYELKLLDPPGNLEVKNLSNLIYLGKDEILITGGKNAKGGGISKSCQIYCPAKGYAEKWVDMNQQRYDHAVTILQGNIVVTGGIIEESEDNYTVTNTCEMFDSSQLKWKPLPNMKHPRHNHDMLIYNNQIYLIGGQQGVGPDSNYKRQIERLTVKQDAWEKLDFKLHYGMSCFTLGKGIFPNEFYVFFGRGHDCEFSQPFCYNLLEKTVKKLPRSSYRQCASNMPALNVDGLLYSINPWEGYLERMQMGGWYWEDLTNYSAKSLLKEFQPFCQFGYARQPIVIQTGPAEPRNAYPSHVDVNNSIIILGSALEPFILVINLQDGKSEFYPQPLSFRSLYNSAKISHKDIGAGKCMIFGGASYTNTKSYVRSYLFDGAKGQAQRLADMPFAVSQAKVAYIAPYAYVLGGYKGWEPCLKVLKYHIKNNKWEEGTSMSIARQEGMYLAFNDKILAFGGQPAGDDSQKLRSFEVYYTQENVWKVSNLQIPDDLLIIRCPQYQKSDKDVLIFGQIQSSQIQDEGHGMVWNLNINNIDGNGQIDGSFNQVTQIPEPIVYPLLYAPLNKNYALIFGSKSKNYENKFAQAFNMQNMQFEVQSDINFEDERDKGKIKGPMQIQEQLYFLNMPFYQINNTNMDNFMIINNVN